ncbi:hypothetical protein LJR228_002426 [Mesorhizobium caraganae]
MGDDHDRRRGKGRSLDRQQRVVRQPPLERRVDQIVAGPFEVMQHCGGPALGRRQRRKQLIGLVENFQSYRGRLQVAVARCLLRWGIPAWNPQQGDVVAIFGEKPGQFGHGAVFATMIDCICHDADAARLAFL